MHLVQNLFAINLAGYPGPTNNTDNIWPLCLLLYRILKMKDPWI